MRAYVYLSAAASAPDVLLVSVCLPPRIAAGRPCLPREKLASPSSEVQLKGQMGSMNSAALHMVERRLLPYLRKPFANSWGLYQFFTQVTKPLGQFAKPSSQPFLNASCNERNIKLRKSNAVQQGFVNLPSSCPPLHALHKVASNLQAEASGNVAIGASRAFALRLSLQVITV